MHLVSFVGLNKVKKNNLKINSGVLRVSFRESRDGSYDASVVPVPVVMIPDCPAYLPSFHLLLPLPDIPLLPALKETTPCSYKPALERFPL